MSPPGSCNIMFSIDGINTVSETMLIFLYNGTRYTWWQAMTNNNEEGTPLLSPNFYTWDRDITDYILTTNINPYVGYWGEFYFFPITILNPFTNKKIMLEDSLNIC